MLHVTASEDTLLKIIAVIHGKHQSIINDELCSEVMASTSILVEAYACKNDSIKDYNFYVSMAETFLRDYHSISPELFICFIRSITDKNIYLTYSDIPYFRDMVKLYGPILRQSRSLDYNKVQEYLSTLNV